LAGAGMKEIKTRIASVENTKQITKAMELVASSKFRKAKERAENSKGYFNTLNEAVQNIARNTSGSKSEFLKVREVKNKCYVVIAGDRGLAGGYNSNVFKALIAETKDSSKVKLVSIGKKAKEFANKLGVMYKEWLMGEYPMIKCNINNSEKIYHLPFDQQYWRTIIEPEKGEFYAMTVKEATQAGFRRAFKHRSLGNE
jgi:ATP synthase F1 gamma subunit